jgi:hypothetical protein
VQERLRALGMPLFGHEVKDAVREETA